MNSITIRPVVLEDKEAWLELWAAYNAFYRASVPEEVTELTWHRILDPSVPIQSLVAVDGANVLGFVTYLFHFSTWSPTHLCYLEDLFTDPAARGRGAGRLLIEGVADAARATGATRLYWLTEETNTTAQVLYDRVAQRSGFIQYRKPL
jgi:GNAT superfamily N-acetyltransferase